MLKFGVRNLSLVPLFFVAFGSAPSLAGKAKPGASRANEIVSDEKGGDEAVKKIAAGLISGEKNDPGAILRALAELQRYADLSPLPSVQEHARVGIQVFLKQNVCRQFPESCGLPNKER